MVKLKQEHTNDLECIVWQIDVFEKDARMERITYRRKKRLWEQKLERISWEKECVQFGRIMEVFRANAPPAIEESVDEYFALRVSINSLSSIFNFHNMVCFDSVFVVNLRNIIGRNHNRVHLYKKSKMRWCVSIFLPANFPRTFREPSANLPRTFRIP